MLSSLLSSFILDLTVLKQAWSSYHWTLILKVIIIAYRGNHTIHKQVTPTKRGGCAGSLIAFVAADGASLLLLTMRKHVIYHGCKKVHNNILGGCKKRPKHNFFFNKFTSTADCRYDTTNDFVQRTNFSQHEKHVSYPHS